MKRVLSVFLVFIFAFSFCSFPAFAEVVLINDFMDDLIYDQGYAALDTVNMESFNEVWVSDGTSNWAELNSALGGNTLLLGKQYYTGGGGSFNYGAGTGRTVQRNTGTVTKMPVVSYSSNTAYLNMPTTTYNTTTNNYYNQYEINNITYNSTYNVYKISTTTNNYYLTYSPTYVSITNFNDTDQTVSTEELYYKTPDGRNSFYCSAADVNGVSYLYNVKNADMVLEDDGKTLGLWHLDGNFYDSSNWANHASSSSYIFKEDGFNGSFLVRRNSLMKGPATFPFTVPSSGTYTTEFRLFIGLNVGATYRIGIFSDTKYAFLDLPCGQWLTFQFVTSLANLNAGYLPVVYLNGIDVSSSYYYSISNGQTDITADVMHSTVGFKFIPTGFQILDNDGQGDYDVLIDEVRAAKGTLSDGVKFAPYDSNMVFVYPSVGSENDIVVQSGLAVNSYRVGGARPTYPVRGDVYINVEDDVVKHIFQYDAGAWNDVNAAIYKNGEWFSLLNFDLNAVQDDVAGSGSSGGGSSSGDDSSGGSSGGDSGSGVWDKLVESVTKVVGGVVDLVASVATKLLDGVASLLTSLIDLFNNLLSFGGSFGDFLGGLFGFMPPELISVLVLSFTLSILLMVIRFFKK